MLPISREKPGCERSPGQGSPAGCGAAAHLGKSSRINPSEYLPHLRSWVRIFKSACSGFSMSLVISTSEGGWQNTQDSGWEGARNPFLFPLFLSLQCWRLLFRITAVPASSQVLYSTPASEREESGGEKEKQAVLEFGGSSAWGVDRVPQQQWAEGPEVSMSCSQRIME